MKKILIVNNNLHIGGIQKSLVNLLNEISDKYDVDLLLFYNAGELSESLPPNVNVISGGFLTKILGMTYAEAKNEGFFTCAARVFWTIMTRIFKIGFTFGAITKMSHIKGKYDAAVSFMQNGNERVFYGGCAEYVLNSVDSDLKICFIHCDFKNYGGNNCYNRRTLMKFDRIAAVSDSVGKNLLTAVPKLGGRVFTVRNCFDYDEMERKSMRYIPGYTEGIINIFLAARFHSEKGILRMIPIFDRIKHRGFEFVWRIAGDGPDRAQAENLIRQYKLEQNIVILGNLPNPYPYFKRSDIVLVPSYNEAAPMVYNEAAFFGTPVFTTDTTSAKEIIEKNGFGTVCENNDFDIEDRLCLEIQNFKPHKNKTVNFDNSAALSEFDEIINN